jgi:hypothetical protein
VALERLSRIDTLSRIEARQTSLPQIRVQAFRFGFPQNGLACTMQPYVASGCPARRRSLSRVFCCRYMYSATLPGAG